MAGSVIAHTIDTVEDAATSNQGIVRPIIIR
jgi:hypothetical protein